MLTSCFHEAGQCNVFALSNTNIMHDMEEMRVLKLNLTVAVVFVLDYCNFIDIYILADSSQ